MASFSLSSLPRTWRYRVFASFHGPDVRKSFLSHLRRQFNESGITMFDDQMIERGQTITPALKKAIRESRILIIVLSKNYASSTWCLDELLEILKCRRDIGQRVMTIFYGVDPSDVRKQTGDFGIAFSETCARKSEEERRRWIQALTEVGNIAGEHCANWDNEARGIENITKDVLVKLNVPQSRDFDGMVGLETHLRKMMPLLHLDYEDGAMIVGISGPAGIGKTTIARALHSLLSNRYQRSCFVDNLRGSYHSGFDEYGLKLLLQEQFLSKVLNHNGMKICHLGAIKEHLCDQKVLIILDDVNNLKQLEALAKETTWFGPGSRIIVTTENEELLQEHGINNTYHVGFPSNEEAIKIISRYALKKTSIYPGFEKLAVRAAELCGNLPLALRVVGSSFRGKKEDEWEDVMNKLERMLDRDIEDVLRVGYESLDEDEQTLFLHIAIFFNKADVGLVKAMFDDGNLDIKRNLNILVYRSLIEISTHGNRIEMHKLLRQVGRQAVQRQEPWKRKILMDAHEICDVLENETGTRAVSGISFDISGINELIVSERAFKRMSNLQFLSVYKSKDDGKERMYIPKGMELPRRLRLLDWQTYPSKCLPPTFHPEHLVELCMWDSQLEYLWQGTQLITNLKKMDLRRSFHLKELPNLSNATNLEELELSHCESLVELTSSFSHLQKLKKLYMRGCMNLQVIPSNLNLASLEIINMKGCSKVRNFSFHSMNFRDVDISYIEMEEVPTSIKLWSRLECLIIRRSGKLEGLRHLPTSLWWLDLSNSDIERIPYGIKDLHQLQKLRLSGCKRLSSLPELPGSLKSLKADDCESLEIVFSPLNHSLDATLDFTNCLKLDQQAQRVIIESSSFGESFLLPGREVPAKFDHLARGNTLTIGLDGIVSNPPSALSRLKLCVVVSPNNHISEYSGDAQDLLCRRVGKGDLDSVEEVFYVGIVSKYLAEHLFIFDSSLLFIDPFNLSRELVLEFSSESHEFDIIECGAQIFTEETFEKSHESESGQMLEDDHDILTTGSYEFELGEAYEDDTKYGDRTNRVRKRRRTDKNGVEL